MAFTSILDQVLGIQPIATTDTVKNHDLGTIVRAADSTLGMGEFIYLKGVANTAVGSLVVYNPVAGTTTLAPNTANLAQPLAVAMSANVASQYGWYQIGGVAVIKKTATIVNPEVKLHLSATAGSVMATAASGKEIQNARSANAASVVSATTTIQAIINRPFAQGRVT